MTKSAGCVVGDGQGAAGTGHVLVCPLFCSKMKDPEQIVTGDAVKSLEERKAIFERAKKRNSRESLRLEGMKIDRSISLEVREPSGPSFKVGTWSLGPK